MSTERSAWQLAYETSPILLTGGSAASVLGGILPIAAILDPVALISGLIGGGPAAIGKFVVVPGGTLINNEVGQYPFANQSVAANAVIFQPLNISLMLIAPAGSGAGYALKIAAFTALRASLAAHNAAGGTYTVLTPAYFYQNCLLTSLRDVSSSDTLQVQYQWQFDFTQPLITLAAAKAAQNAFTSAITSGAQVTPPSG